MQQPRIGITLDWSPGKAEGFSNQPHYALRVHYFQAVYAAGGLPVGIPLLAGAAPAYLAYLDGLLIPGGDFPFPDAWYKEGFGKNASPHAGSPSHRAEVDAELIEAALAQDLPLLGICAGMQALAAVSGCRLSNRIEALTATTVVHRSNGPEGAWHPIKVAPGTRLGRILGREILWVNSAHNEAVWEIAAPVQFNACAPDGVIEGIEVSDRRFALGVQWHPELLALGEGADVRPHLRLFQSLVEAARNRTG
jgi:putative glutamine amidotransferase